MTLDDPPTLDELRTLAWHWGQIRHDDLWWVSTEDGYDCLAGDHRAAALQPVYRHARLTALPVYPPTRGMFVSELTDDPAHVRITWPTQWRQIPTWTVTPPVEPLRDAILDAERYTGRYWATLLVRDTSRAKRWQIARIEAHVARMVLRAQPWSVTLEWRPMLDVVGRRERANTNIHATFGDCGARLDGVAVPGPRVREPG